MHTADELESLLNGASEAIEAATDIRNWMKFGFSTWARKARSRLF